MGKMGPLVPEYSGQLRGPSSLHILLRSLPRTRSYVRKQFYGSNSLAVLVQSIERSGGVNCSIAQADLEHRYGNAATSQSNWAPRIAKLVLKARGRNLDDLAVARVMSDHYWFGGGAQGYPLFGLYRLLAHSRKPDRVERVLEPFRGACRFDVELAGHLHNAAGRSFSSKISGEIFRSVHRARGRSSAPLSALETVKYLSGSSAAREFALALVTRNPANESVVGAALSFLCSSGEEEKAVQAAEQAADCCDNVTALTFLAKRALARNALVTAKLLTSRLRADGDAGESIVRQVLEIEAEVELRLAEQALRQALPRDKSATLARFCTTLREASTVLPAPRIRKAMAFALAAAVDSQQLTVFERLMNEVAGEGGIALHILIEMVFERIRGDLRPAVPVPLKTSLIAEATDRWERGLSKGAFMLWRLAANVGELSQNERMQHAYVALAVGRFDVAAELFGPLRRVYREELRQVSWPRSASGLPWPYEPICAAAEWICPFPEGVQLPRISIIVPSFNQAKYVRECLLSLKHQAYPSLEVIVFDACSTDGTAEIIREFSNCFDRIVIEPDQGQSDAINKGMSIATGDLLHWLNTDDILAPGACHAAALAFLTTDADLIAGACVEMSDREMLLYNVPSASSDELKVSELCKQFERWMKGHFFYQPEVFFTRRIWDRVGGKLDVKLNFAMDFEFWLRCAQAGATYQRIGWPIAFFRKHEEQKTSALSDTIDEQARIINTVSPQVPSPERRREIQRQLRQSSEKSNRRVAVVSKRFDKIFSSAVLEDLKTESSAGVSFELHRTVESVRCDEVDQIIQLAHAQCEYLDAEYFRAHGYKGALVLWFWDNHHNYFENRKSAEAADVLVPGHAFCSGYLANQNAILTDPIPLCVTQWGQGEAAQLFAEVAAGQRSNELLGGFVEYEMGRYRNRLIADLIDSGISSEIHLMPEDSISRYFSKSQRERFEYWARFKSSLCLPLRGDLSQRFFDAWLTGQIPIVPANFPDLHRFIAPSLIADHVVTFEDWSVPSIQTAHAEAIKKFDQAGFEGVLQRHRTAINECFFVDRLKRILHNCDLIASEGQPQDAILVS